MTIAAFIGGFLLGVYLMWRQEKRICDAYIEHMLRRIWEDQQQQCNQITVHKEVSIVGKHLYEAREIADLIERVTAEDDGKGINN